MRLIRSSLYKWKLGQVSVWIKFHRKSKVLNNAQSPKLMSIQQSKTQGHTHFEETSANIGKMNGNTEFYLKETISRLSSRDIGVEFSIAELL